jgi:UDPglucose 6-dehydrogenase
MKIAVIGTGYVGLVTGTCFADSGNDVTCVDIDQAKIDQLNRGDIPIYEPGLEELVHENQNKDVDRLHFTTDFSTVSSAKLVYLAVGTPQREDGRADLGPMRDVVVSIAPHLAQDAIVVIKSTVPVFTNDEINRRLRELTGRDCDVASNPEFLKEGSAIDDFKKPDRVVVGVRRQDVSDVLRELYKPYLRSGNPFYVMSPESAELTKYVANAMLASRISFMNEVSNLCEKLGANIDDVRIAVGKDERIGKAFLFPGPGYGGSCFPKDVRQLIRMFEDRGIEPRLTKAVDEVNEIQKRVMIEKLNTHFSGQLSGKTIAVWGVAFKPQTDDIRESPALLLIEWLLQQGAVVRVHDPAAIENTRRHFGDGPVYCDKSMNAIQGADALAIMTHWGDYQGPDFKAMLARMRSPVVFDGRNLFEPESMQRLGFVYHSIGRPAVGNKDKETRRHGDKET